MFSKNSSLGFSVHLINAAAHAAMIYDCRGRRVILTPYDNKDVGQT